jgi:HprK-related kinase A
VECLLNGGATLRLEPFTLHVSTNMSDVAAAIATLYDGLEFDTSSPFSDFYVAVRTPSGLRSIYKPKAYFHFDGDSPFQPLPRQQALPLLEWGINWAIATYLHNLLVVHAAVVEKNGHAVIMPAPPGSGKSTLCAALACRGWRLLSDEMALISLDDQSLHPMPRPVSLKNASIDVMKRFNPSGRFSAPIHDTLKGTVVLMRSGDDSIAGFDALSKPAWIIFPEYRSGSDTALTPRSQAQTFLQIGRNAFNYSILGEIGFDVLGRVVDMCRCFDFRYSDLESAIETFDNLEAGRL